MKNLFKRKNKKMTKKNNFFVILLSAKNKIDKIKLIIEELLNLC